MGEEANPLTEIDLYGILHPGTARRITRLEDRTLEGWLTLVSSTLELFRVDYAERPGRLHGAASRAT